MGQSRHGNTYIALAFLSLSVKGGRFDVFEHMWSKSDFEQMNVLDANCLYASIARDLEVPVGAYEIWTNMDILSQIWFDKNKNCHFFQNQEMIGFALLRVSSPYKGIPFIGVKVTEQYIHTLCQTCAKKKAKKTCRHQEKSRSIVATLTWPEINFMVSRLSYTILEIFEVYQWSEKKVIFSEFVKLLEYFKLKSESPSCTKKTFCEKMNSVNRFPPQLILQPSDINPNPSSRKMYKEILCAVLGKMAQVNSRNQTKMIKSQSALTSLFYSNESKIDDIFVVGKACMAVTSCRKSQQYLTNKSASMIVYAYVTASSRIYMHSTMLFLQEKNCRMLAIFNDCLYFVSSFDTIIPLDIGQHFYSFKHEVPSHQIIAFISFGVKCNALQLILDNGKTQTLIKARGFSLKSKIAQQVLTFSKLTSMIKNPLPESVNIPQLRTKKKIRKLTATQDIQIFTFRNEIKTHNIVLSNMRTLPLGYKHQ